jgi:hypothetical protein
LLTIWKVLGGILLAKGLFQDTMCLRYNSCGID